MTLVLTVDDSKTMRDMVSFTLKNAGFDVIEAEHGQDGLAKLNTAKVDVIISDINMPVMDGIAFIKAVRASSKAATVPILILTTESEQSKRDEGKNAGATGWIVKPFNPEKLVQVIKKVCP